MVENQNRSNFLISISCSRSGSFLLRVNALYLTFCFREEWLRCNGMPCEEKAMVNDLTELLMNELTLGEYQSPQAAQVKLSIFILSFPRHNLKTYINEVF